MKLYRAELVYAKPNDDDPHPQRHIPTALRLVDPDNGNTLEIPGVRDVSVHWSPRDVRTLKLELIVSGFDEVFE